MTSIRRRARRPLQFRVVVAVLVLLIAIVGALGTSQVLAARNSLRSQVDNNQRTAAKLAASAFASALSTRLELISNIASQPTLPGIFTPPGNPELGSIGATLHLVYPTFSSFVLINGSGVVVARYPTTPSVIGKNISTSQTYTGPATTGKPYITSAVQQTVAPHKLVVGLAAPVKNASGELVGVLDGTLAAKTLGTVIGGTSLVGGGNLVIVNQQGHALSGPAAGASVSYRTMPTVIHALGGVAGSDTGKVPGYVGTRIVGYAPVPDTGWAVIAEAPPSVLNGPIGALTVRLVWIGVLVLLLAIGAVLVSGLLLRRLTDEHEQAGSVLASVGEGVATTDSDGRPLTVNPALLDLTGRPEAELIGAEWQDAFGIVNDRGHDVPWSATAGSQAVHNQEVVSSTGYNLFLRRPDGEVVPITLTAAPLIVRGELKGAAVVIRDVRREQEADQLKTSLVSTVSHELRTPLTMIQGFSELLVDRGDLGADRSREALTQIHTSSQRLGRLIDDLLSVSRIDSGKTVVELAPLYVNEVIDEVVTAFETQTDRRRFVTDVQAGMPRVIADRDKLVQILTNLLSNSVKYSDEGTPITVRAHSDDGSATMEVVDLGNGLTPAEQTKIFEKFTRLDRPEERKASGTGLGLYITRSLVELQGGRMWVTSQPGKGSTFAFTLPSAAAELTREPSANTNGRATGERQGVGRENERDDEEGVVITALGRENHAHALDR